MVTIFLFLLPGLLLFVSILIAPIAVSLYRGTFDWNGFSEGTFIGFDNYIELFTNGSIKFMTALKNSMILAFFSVFVQLPFSLFLALLVPSFCLGAQRPTASGGVKENEGCWVWLGDGPRPRKPHLNTAQPQHFLATRQCRPRAITLPLPVWVQAEGHAYEA